MFVLNLKKKKIVLKFLHELECDKIR